MSLNRAKTIYGQFLSGMNVSAELFQRAWRRLQQN